MSRLYWRIYLSVLGSLIVFALLAALTAAAFHVFDDKERPLWRAPETGIHIAERLLPQGVPREILQKELSFWQQRSGYSLMLLAPDGTVIGEAGKFPPEERERLLKRAIGQERLYWRGWSGVFGATFTDGRKLIAYEVEDDHHWLHNFRWFGALLGIALAVGIAAYPLIRHLSRRLERLEQGVAAFGDGDLSARITISGRDEIARLATTFNASADRIEALLNAHKALLANASHELRSPLSRLRMAVETATVNGEDNGAKAEIRRNIAELDTLIEEILLSSRLQAGAEGRIEREALDLAGLIAEECAAYEADFDVAAMDSVIIEGDGRLLKRLFRNLLENAARYGGERRINVNLRADGQWMLASICDHGPGIPEAEQEKIFEPFYRMKGAAESSGGVGLGLALVRQIAERHGGTVICRTRNSGGACFEVRLPS